MRMKIGSGPNHAVLQYKSRYMRRKDYVERFNESVRKSQDPIMWEKFTDMTEKKFKEKFELNKNDLSKPINKEEVYGKEKTKMQRNTRCETLRTILSTLPHIYEKRK